MKNIIIGFIALAILFSCKTVDNSSVKDFQFNVPAEYLEEREDIPAFWLATTKEIEQFIKNNVHKGKWEMLGKSAGGRPIYAVTYGTQRSGKGTAH